MQDPDNLCRSTWTVAVYQNIFPPVAVIAPNNASLTCVTNSLMLTNQSSTGIPLASNFPRNKFVVGELWEGPSPQLPLSESTSYEAMILGNYTLTARDENNGCKSKTVTVVGENRNVPLLNDTVMKQPVLECGFSTGTIVPNVKANTSNLSYTWTAPTNASVTGQNTKTLVTNSLGTFTVRVRNNLSGCESFTTMTIINDTLSASFSVDKPSGFAPHPVSVFNNSSSKNSTASITAVWSWGDGTFDTTRSVTRQPVKTYQQPGTYTIVMFAFKGICKDTAIRIVTVDVPSRLHVPNIFTPNGDGINDLYFLGAANLTEIDAEIYDRWGSIVYKVLSSKGNLAWDGKDSGGVDVPEGVYYYHIKATGRDSQNYEYKGNITLVR
jgi:gliding motility-associated-like protein